MSTSTYRSVLQTAACIIGLAFAACDGGSDFPQGGDGGQEPEFPGIVEIDDMQLGSVSCTFSGTALSFALAANQPVIVSLRSSDSAILVNDAACVSATGVTATTVNAKKLTITGTSGNDTVILDYLNGGFLPGAGTAVGVELNFAGGSDALKIRGSKSADFYTAGASGLSINNDTVKDISVSSTGTLAITISSGPGTDTVSGAGGYGTGAAYAGALVIYGADANDVLSGGDGADTIYGGLGNDTIKGGGGADTLYGEDGADTFDDGADANGADAFNGGAGTDTVSYASRSAGVTVSVGDSSAGDGKTGASEGDDVKADVEVVTGSASADTLTGDGSANILNGGGGGDSLTGGDGDDTLNGGDGDDTFLEGDAANGADAFNGGAGTDTVNYASREDTGVTVTIDGTADDGATDESEGDNVKTDVENLVGTELDDEITGSASANAIEGGGGADTLAGGAGNDTFHEGDDAASSGGDAIDGGDGVDTVDYSGRSEELVVDMSDATANDGEDGEADDIGETVENLICGAAACTVVGNAGDNTIVGAAAAVNDLSGGDGDDHLYGGSEDDVLSGGAGDDLLDGGDGDNTLDCGDGQGDIAFGGSHESCEL